MRNLLLLLLFLTMLVKTQAHPMPGSIVELSVMENCIRGEAIIPLIELENAVGVERIRNLDDPFLKDYFTQHIRASNLRKYWSTQISDIILRTSHDPLIGEYKTVLVRFTLKPDDKQELRKFIFNYDAVIHQVVTHNAIVSVKQDWNNGMFSEGKTLELGIIKMDMSSGKTIPLEVHLEDGSQWKGFKKIFYLGVSHIKYGTDHLLFLIVLILPSILLKNGRKWEGVNKTKNSLIGLIKIVSAFTIGHTLSLFIGVLGWINMSQQLVEIMISISILFSAVHAMYPIFAGKEMHLAGGFGLVHGLAFASVLSNLILEPSTFVLSVIGFNLGVESMQLLIIAAIIPWLLLLSKTSFYDLFRFFLASLAGVAAVAWIFERSTNESNFITDLLYLVPDNGLQIIGTLAVISVFGFILNRLSSKTGL